jgi:hypothetical protein
MMVNNKYATAWTYYNETKSMNVILGFSSFTKKYSTCILFLSSEVPTELANSIAEHEIVVTIYYYYQVTPSDTHHPPHMLSHTSWIKTSNKEQGNNMHLLIHQEYDKDSHLIDYPTK